MNDIVIVGASLAGVRAAEGVRRAGWPGRIVLVGAESHFPPFDRPPMTKQLLAGEWTLDQARLRVSESIADELLLGRRAEALDVRRHEVRLDDGSVVPYAGAVIATGATARELPEQAALRNVVSIRALEDVYALKRFLGRPARVAVVGAGVLGCEVAATCTGLGHDITLIDVLAAPMTRVIGTELGNWLAEIHVKAGVRVRCGRRIEGFTRSDDVVTTVQLDGDESVPVDVVVVAIGAMPQTSWLSGSGLDIDDGVRCDETGFAVGGDRRIVVAGDAARWEHPLLGRAVRVEHWTNAAAQGRLAGSNLVAELAGTAAAAPYSQLPYSWSDQFDLKIQTAGLIGASHTVEIVEGSLEERCFVAEERVGDRTASIVCVNSPARFVQSHVRLLEEWKRAARQR